MKEDGDGDDHYTRSIFYKLLGGKIFGDKKGQQAACDICVDYIVNTFKEIKVNTIDNNILSTVLSSQVLLTSPFLFPAMFLAADPLQPLIAKLTEMDPHCSAQDLAGR